MQGNITYGYLWLLQAHLTRGGDGGGGGGGGGLLYGNFYHIRTFSQVFFKSFSQNQLTDFDQIKMKCTMK